MFNNKGAFRLYKFYGIHRDETHLFDFSVMAYSYSVVLFSEDDNDTDTCQPVGHRQGWRPAE